MRLVKTEMSDVFIIHPFLFEDARGGFVKTMQDVFFEEHGLNFNFRESFYSISHKNVIRGLHFQYPPQDHDKLVYVVKGRILDVVLDLRRSSPTFGHSFSIELNETNKHMLYIGKGIAHGFLALEDNSIVEYHTTTSQSRELEGGILWNSFGFEWPIENPIMSDRDKAFVSFKHFTPNYW